MPLEPRRPFLEPQGGAQRRRAPPRAYAHARAGPLDRMPSTTSTRRTSSRTRSTTSTRAHTSSSTRPHAHSATPRHARMPSSAHLEPRHASRARMPARVYSAPAQRNPVATRARMPSSAAPRAVDPEHAPRTPRPRALPTPCPRARPCRVHLEPPGMPCPALPCTSSRALDASPRGRMPPCPAPRALERGNNRRGRQLRGSRPLSLPARTPITGRSWKKFPRNPYHGPLAPDLRGSGRDTPNPSLSQHSWRLACLS